MEDQGASQDTLMYEEKSEYGGNDTSLDPKLLKMYLKNRKVDGAAFYLLIFAYSLLILFGSMGNILAILAVCRKPSMRTPRNMFIINLAVSDLLLCIITMPLTLMEILTMYWPFGKTVYICKLVGGLQAISIFVSTISITAIALDRYHVIVYPTKASVQRVGAALVLTIIWILSFLLALPLIIWRRLVNFPLSSPVVGLTEVNFCYEDWPFQHGRTLYSIFTIIVQYVIPIIVVSVAYAQICKKLRYRMKPGTHVEGARTDGSGGTSGSGGGGGGSKDQARVRRTNVLLISIALVFGISWMPLNLFNVIMDLTNSWKTNRELFSIAYALCHMAGMSSACSNPIIYGYFNDNFKREYKEIWVAFKQRCVCTLRSPRILTAARESVRRRNVDHEEAAVQYRKSNTSPEGEIEQSTLITQVLDRQK